MYKSQFNIVVTSSFLSMASLGVSATVPVTPPPITPPPDTPACSGAAASLGVIWPPDHTMVAITIVGVTDPNGLPINIAISESTRTRQ